MLLLFAPFNTNTKYRQRVKTLRPVPISIYIRFSQPIFTVRCLSAVCLSFFLSFILLFFASMRSILVVLLRVSTKRILITLLRINLNSRKIGWREKTKNINKSRVQSDSIHRMGTRSKRMKFDEWLSLKKLDYISRNEYKCENYSCSSIFSHDAF